jgi:hypothetical protein
MALFGAPLTHEDHALRACYAALRMREAVKRYADEVRRSDGVRVQIRVGLNSGEVVVRSIGSDLRMEYSAVGRTTYLAARMEQLAAPGSIQLTAETLRLVEGLVEVNPLGPVPIKGLSEPVEVFELVATGAARTRLEAAERRGLTRFVGRSAELEQLRDALWSQRCRRCWPCSTCRWTIPSGTHSIRRSAAAARLMRLSSCCCAKRASKHFC